MKTPKPKLFTEEFIGLCLIMLSFVIGTACLLVYQDRLPLWMILVIGFWYPVAVGLRTLWYSLNKDGEDL